MTSNIRMHRSHKIDGVQVSFSRSIVGWVAIFGPGRAVHFTQVGSSWVARQPGAEPMVTAKTLEGAVRFVRRQFAAEDQAAELRVAERLRAALAEIGR